MRFRALLISDRMEYRLGLARRRHNFINQIRARMWKHNDSLRLRSLPLLYARAFFKKSFGFSDFLR